MTNKIKFVRTNERCYICDFHSKVDEDPADSLYMDSLTDGSQNPFSPSKPWHYYQNEEGRYVLVDPRDGKPICTQCLTEVAQSVKELEEIDRNFEPVPIREQGPEQRRKEKIFNKIVNNRDDWNIDWDNLEYNDNGTVKFPLTLKDTPKPLGQRWHTRANEHPITEEHRKQIEEILEKKGLKKDPVWNPEMDNHLYPLPKKERLAPCSDWPMTRTSRDSSEDKDVQDVPPWEEIALETT